MNNRAPTKQSLISLIAVAAMVLAGAASDSRAAALNLSDSPVFLLTAVDPNIIFTYDDSGSMARAYMPDGINANSGNRRYCSSTFNGIYYDPNVKYEPGVDTNGDPLPDASFTGAWINGYKTGAGTVNLSTNYQAVVTTNSDTTANASFATCNTTPANPAFYYVYDTSLGGCTSSITNDSCYRLVRVSATSGTGPVGADERTNFANWYSYYRVRTLTAMTAAGRAFARLSDTVRVAYQRINSCTENLGTQANGTGLTGGTGCYGNTALPFSTTRRTNFFNWLYASPASGNTPLRSAFRRAGEYIGTTNANSPWAQTPGTSVGTEFTCRQNFHVAFTDGLWNSDTGLPSYGNTENATTILPTPDPLAASPAHLQKTYSPGGLPAGRRIYPDTNSDSLADIAFHYWKTDARTGLVNNVPPHITDKNGTLDEQYYSPDNDVATWQHLVNYTVGLGVTGLLNPANYFDRTLPNSDGHYDELLAGTMTWGATAANNTANIDDLWHAAVNSRGRYFSARSPQELVNSLAAVFNDISSRSGSAAALSANAGSVGSSTLLYQTKFNSADWSGRLLAYGVNPADGTINTTPTWDAAVVLNQTSYTGATGRKIISYSPTTRDGIAFQWADLDAGQKTALDINSLSINDGFGDLRLDYLRGSSANEGTGKNFRVRSCTDITGLSVPCPANNGKLADMVHSAPIYVGAPPFRYRDNLEAIPYDTFHNANKSRTPVVYVGSNDGMLHGFDGTNGKELIAYVPGPVYSNLSLLTAPNYSHRFYVDGSPIVGDVFIDIPGVTTGKDWRTVLVGGLRKGGRGYFALDVTNPTNFQEANARDLVLWEFTDDDLGFSYNQPSIVRMANGKWAAIFGSGYNNINPGTGRATLFIVFIEDGIDGTWTVGSDYIKISTGVGDTTTPNGLADPVAVDVNRDSIVDIIYAGDQQGNVWRFDVSSPTVTDWSLSASTRRLYTTQANQAITTRPVVGRHPSGGVLVYFGTGKHLESSDNNLVNPPTQTFYAIWDRAGFTATVTLADLLQQVIDTATGNINGFEVRTISNNPIKWRQPGMAAAGSHLGWYVNLPTSGERVINEALLREERVIFTTFIPSTTACTPGGDGWLMELNAITGGRLSDTFDLTNDGALTVADKLTMGTQKVAVSGVKSTGGAPSTPVILQGPPAAGSPPGQCIEYKYSSTNDGRNIRMPEKCEGPRRESWMQTK